MLADAGTRLLWWGGGAPRRTSRSRDGGGQAILAVAALILVVLAPVAAQLMYFALSRRREYLADASSALFTRYPEGLARALEKIERHKQPLRAANRATAPMYIVNPLAGVERLASLSSTHPPTSERVRILRALGGGGGRLSLAGYDEAFRSVTGRAVGVVPAGALRAEPIDPRGATPPDRRSKIERVRQATDSLWRLQDYAFLACPCGTSIKVPPEHAGRAIRCPQCGREHRADPASAGAAR